MIATIVMGLAVVAMIALLFEMGRQPWPYSPYTGNGVITDDDEPPTLQGWPGDPPTLQGWPDDPPSLR